MRMKTVYKMPFKRRKEGKTDYNARLKLLMGKKPRLVVRRSLNLIRVQVIDFDFIGDKVLVSALSTDLRKMGWKFSTDNIPASYLTGLLAGKRALAKGIKGVVLDSGPVQSTKGSRIYAAAKGAIDAGLSVPVGEEVIPSDDRIRGVHIAKYQEKFKDLPAEFEKVKSKIMGE
jgi:large subunit ribosomal protein L18